MAETANVPVILTDCTREDNKDSDIEELRYCVCIYLSVLFETFGLSFNDLKQFVCNIFYRCFRAVIDFEVEFKFCHVLAENLYQTLIF